MHITIAIPYSILLLLSSCEAPPPTGSHNSFPSYTYTMTNSSNLVNTDAATPIGLPMPYFDFDPELTGRSTAPNSIIGGSPSDDSLDVDIAPSQIQHNNATEQSNAPSQLQESDSSLSRYKRIYNKAGRFYHQNSFLILVTCAILLAYAYPPLGAKYVAPKITATWIAVIFIFILAGMGIRTEELTKALQRVYFNSFVQVFNFMVVSGTVYGFTRFMLHVNALPESLADGMTITSTLSVSVNMGIVLTKLVGGDEAAAIFDAAFGNFLGVFLSPALILMYLGLNAEVDLGQVTLKLFLRVVLPLFVGQLLRNFFPPAKAFAKKYNHYFRQGQEFSLVFIVYTIFCKTFLKGSDAAVVDILIMIGCVLLVLLFIMGLAWLSMLVLFPKDPKLQAVGLFACTHKTVAVGIPLITSIYADSPMLGLYVLPLLIWYPTQLVLGTALAPHLAKYVARKEKELKQKEEQPVEGDDANACRDEEHPGNSKSPTESVSAATENV
jgi:sodium/bile acid cotransporter 7